MNINYYKNPESKRIIVNGATATHLFGKISKLHSRIEEITSVGTITRAKSNELEILKNNLEILVHFKQYCEKGMRQY
jgi:hypothetical protein